MRRANIDLKAAKQVRVASRKSDGVVSDSQRLPGCAPTHFT
jgi:hypothetical protein